MADDSQTMKVSPRHADGGGGMWLFLQAHSMHVKDIIFLVTHLNISHILQLASAAMRRTKTSSHGYWARVRVGFVHKLRCASIFSDMCGWGRVVEYALSVPYLFTSQKWSQRTDHTSLPTSTLHHERWGTIITSCKSLALSLFTSDFHSGRSAGARGSHHPRRTESVELDQTRVKRTQHYWSPNRRGKSSEVRTKRRARSTLQLLTRRYTISPHGGCVAQGVERAWLYAY